MQNISVEMLNVPSLQETAMKQLDQNTYLMNGEEFESRIIKRKEADEPVKLVVFGCMPELIPSVYDNRYIRYDFAGSGLKSTIDYKAERFNDLQNEIAAKYEISTEMTCLIADTEARVKSDGLLRPVTKEEVRVKALKVAKRVSKNFPGNVLLRSELFPVASKTYRENFLETFREVARDEQSYKQGSGPENPRIISRMTQLTGLGADLDVAYWRSLRDVALMDAEYAMEGLWLTTESDFDALIIADNYPFSSYQRMFRLSPEANLPVIFLGPYEKF